jgi:hypothetical protein
MENPKSMTPEQKALMVSIGSARVHEALLVDGFRTNATAGPGAGGSSVFIRSGDRSVRLPSTRTHRSGLSPVLQVFR